VASADAFVGYAPSLEDATLPQVETFRQAYLDLMAY
jgi:2-oxoisovalerate dehydrogenase E1 component